MKIRKYISSDLRQCRYLYAEMIQRHRDLYSDETIGGADPGKEFDKHLKLVGEDKIWVAENNGELVGLVSLIVNGQQAEIEPIVVKKECRGRNIGKMLLKKVTEEAENIGILCLSVKPVVRNKEAISFFHKSGFNSLGQVELFKWLGPPSQFVLKSDVIFLGESFNC